MENKFLSRIIARNNGIPKSNVGSYMVVHQEVRNTLPTTKRAQGEHM
uniref:Uncharacterized protein n=1 Tax=Cucumis melo TaxID=3656 RepID=A0A9I9DT52_CUCME